MNHRLRGVWRTLATGVRTLGRLALVGQLVVFAWVTVLWLRLHRRLRRAAVGQSLVEYSVLTAIVVFGGMVIYVKFGQAISDLFNRMITKLGGLAN